MVAKTGRKSGSAPVCWDCKTRIPLDCKWKRFAPEIVLPPAAVIVCGVKCPDTPTGSKVFHADDLMGRGRAA